MDIIFNVMRIWARQIFDVILKSRFPCAISNIEKSCRNFYAVAEIHITMINFLMWISFWIRTFLAHIYSLYGPVWNLLIIFEIHWLYRKSFGTIMNLSKMDKDIVPFGPVSPWISVEIVKSENISIPISILFS